MDSQWSTGLDESCSVSTTSTQSFVRCHLIELRVIVNSVTPWSNVMAAAGSSKLSLIFLGPTMI